MSSQRTRVLSWNVYVGQAPASVTAALLWLVAFTWPHVIVLQEAKRWQRSLPGYRRHAASPGLREDAANCVVLVRAGVRWASARPLPVPEPAGQWTFHEPKPARVFYGIVVRGVAVIDLHRCVFGYTRNARAWRAEDQTLAAAVPAHGAVAMLGDWNAPAAAAEGTGSLSPAYLASRLGGRLVTDPDRAGIDYALVRGRQARLRRLRRKFGSDHHPVLLTLDRET